MTELFTSLLFLILMPAIILFAFAKMSGANPSKYLNGYIDFWMKLTASIIAAVAKITTQITMALLSTIPYFLDKALPKVEKTDLGDPQEPEEKEPANKQSSSAPEPEPEEYKYGQGPVVYPDNPVSEQAPEKPSSNTFQSGFKEKKAEEPKKTDKPTDPYANPPEPEVME